MPGTTPTYGFPYPLPTEPIYQGAQRIRELAERMEQIIGGVSGSNPPFEHVTIAAPQSIPNNTLTTVVFDTRNAFRSNQPAMLQPDGTLRCTQSGVYLATAFVRWAANATGYRMATIARNRAGARTYRATPQDPAMAIAGVTHRTIVTTQIACEAGDAIELRVQHTAGAALNVLGDGGYADGSAHMEVCWLRSF